MKDQLLGRQCLTHHFIGSAEEVPVKKSLLTLLALTVLSGISITPSAHAFAEEIREIETVIEKTVGTKVLWSNGHSLCKRNTYGFYHPAKDVVVMCQENHKYDYHQLVATLKHEGWHAVQYKCNNNRAALSDELIRKHMDSRTSDVLHSYPHKQHRSEAEARIVEKIPTANWIQGVKIYCS